jgi:hypothetical protein
MGGQRWLVQLKPDPLDGLWPPETMVTENELDELNEIQAKQPPAPSAAHRLGRFFWTIVLCLLAIWLARGIWSS